MLDHLGRGDLWVLAEALAGAADPDAEATPGSLAQAAHTQDERLADFSNGGSFVKPAAPGDRIISTFPGGGHATWSGTSMATPPPRP